MSRQPIAILFMEGLPVEIKYARKLKNHPFGWKWQVRFRGTDRGSLWSNDGSTWYEIIGGKPIETSPHFEIRSSDETVLQGLLDREGSE